MKVLIGVASHEIQNVRAINSVWQIRRDPQDEISFQARYRGDIAREAFVDHILSSHDYGQEDALLMLDGDQKHPADLLEKLRAHNLDMVCAHYYRRGLNPVQSLCYEIGDGRWPYLPYVHPPREGLHEIAVAGFGCVLIKKKVFEAVKSVLPNGASPVAIGPLPEVTNDYDNFGADFKFFHIARKLGFKLWLDASVESLHAVTLWLGHDYADKLVDYSRWADAATELFNSRLEMYGMELEAFKQRKRILEARREGVIQQINKLRNAKERGEEIDLNDEYQMSIGIYQLEGKIMEMEAWIEWAEKYPKIDRPDQLPTSINTPDEQKVISDLLPNEEIAKQMRMDEYRKHAVELAQMLPDSSARKFYRGDGIE